MREQVYRMIIKKGGSVHSARLDSLEPLPEKKVRFDQPKPPTPYRYPEEQILQLNTYPGGIEKENPLAKKRHSTQLPDINLTSPRNH